MEHKEKKYVVLPGQEVSGQMEFDMEQMKEKNQQNAPQDEYEQMQFQVNSFYEEVSRSRFSGSKGEGAATHLQGNHSVINQKRYDQAQKMYEQAFEQSYQDGYYQGYQECYGKVYEQAYQQAYKQAYDQAYAQQSSAVSELSAKIEGIRLTTSASPVQDSVPKKEEVQAQEKIKQQVVESPKVEEPVKVEEPIKVQEPTKVEAVVLPKLKNNQVKEELNKEELHKIEEIETVNEYQKVAGSAIKEDSEIQAVMGIEQPEELHPERVSLHELAREEYREDVRLYAGKWNRSYVRKFSKMNETKQFLNWNFPAFLFGPLWYAFRKMPLMSIAVLVTMVLSLTTETGLVSAGILMILIGALSDKIYKSHMDRLLDAKSLMGEEAQAKYLKLRGGVSFLYPIALIVLAAGAAVYIKEVLIFKSDFIRGIYDNLINLYHTYL